MQISTEKLKTANCKARYHPQGSTANRKINKDVF